MEKIKNIVSSVMEKLIIAFALAIGVGMFSLIGFFLYMNVKEMAGM